MAKFSKQADICLDTNILIYLAGIENNNKAVIYELKKDGVYSSLVCLMDKIKKEEVRAIITPTVYKEINRGVPKFGTATIDFIKNNNFFLFEIPENQRIIFYEKTNKMIKAYCQKLTNRQKQEIRMKNSKPNFWYADSVFGYDINRRGKIVPINDAIIMAETAIFGIPIITNNTKDFTKEGRKEIIAYINKINHIRPSAIPYTSCEVPEFLSKQKVFQSVNMEWENSIKEISMEQ